MRKHLLGIQLFVCLILCFHCSAYLNWSHSRRSRRTGTLLAFENGPIPSELSVDDTILSYNAIEPFLLPDTSINTLVGSNNLGMLLWAFVLFNGLYIIPTRPSDAVLPLIAKLFNESNAEWFKDFQEGFAYTCPPAVDFARLFCFLGCGYAMNSFIISTLEGDDFWGWSIGACLALPSGLLTLSRTPLLTRADSQQQVLVNQSLLHHR
jgi:hypothetical protein